LLENRRSIAGNPRGLAGANIYWKLWGRKRIDACVEAVLGGPVVANHFALSSQVSTTDVNVRVLDKIVGRVW
jgi:hypothetical protein